MFWANNIREEVEKQRVKKKVFIFQGLNNNQSGNKTSNEKINNGISRKLFGIPKKLKLKLRIWNKFNYLE